MSKIGNYRVGIQETDEYALGWKRAAHGEPMPKQQSNALDSECSAAQKLGWSDYHDAERKA